MGLIKVRLTHYLAAGASAIFLLSAGVEARAEDGIRSYTVPKERSVGDIPVSSAPITWTLPQTWKELPSDAMRIGNFAIPGQDGAKAEAAIFSFPGAVGTELGNVNRWRGELQLPPVEQDQIKSENVTVDSLPGKLYEIAGNSNRTVVAAVPRGDATWFFKMRGDKDVVADAEPVFRDFLKTIHFGAVSKEPPSQSVSAPEPASAPPLADAPDNAGETPKWSVPSNWTEKPPGLMIFKSFSAATGEGKAATVNISFFQGSVGGDLLNVARWRNQVGLPPVEEDKLDTVLQPLDTSAGKAAMVDFTGTDSRTSQPERLVVVTVPHGGNKWFYKLLGDPAAVAAERDRFIKFVQTVQYP